MLAVIIYSILTLGYVLLITAYVKGWKLQENFTVPDTYIPHTSISVIIPARNEACNINACMDAILAQEYPSELLEIIVVDDYSEDNTVGIVKAYKDTRVRCLILAEYLDEHNKITAFKKAALAAGIAQSKGSLIITTDADCTAPALWLMNMVALFELQQPAMIVAPVIFSDRKDILGIFQLIDFMSMQGITAAAHQLNMGNMCNGANLAFSRSSYEAVNGYKGIDHLSSGDDYLLMMKISASFPGKVAYLKSHNAIVSTPPQPSWGAFLQQRIRWASKSGKYNDNRLTAILILVYLFNISFVGIIVAGLFHPVLLYLATAMLVIKIVAEYTLLRLVAAFFEKAWVLKYLPILQPLHIIYIVLAGFMGFTGSYKWKGRSVK